jgi:hypothetical protein
MNTEEELVQKVKKGIKTYLQEEKLKVKDDKTCGKESGALGEDSGFGNF